MTATKPTGEERLRGRMAKWEYGHEWLDALDETIAAAKREGAREAVERIRAGLATRGGDRHMILRGGTHVIGCAGCLLDEEAAR